MNLKGKKFENSRLDMEIYVYDIDGKEWFIGKDVAKILGYSNVSTAVSENVKKSQKKKIYVKTIENIWISEIPNSEIIVVNNNLSFITEIGLYQLVMKSRRKEAEEFQDWVYGEVLPSIRKNNFYLDNENITSEQISNLEKEMKKLKIEKGILHEIVYDISDATTMSFTEVSKKIFKKDAKYLKKMLIEYKFLDKDGYTPLIKEADFKLPEGDTQKMRIFTTTNVEKCRKNEDIRYNKITNFGYMYLKKFFNKKGLSDFNFGKEHKHDSRDV